MAQRRHITMDHDLREEILALAKQEDRKFSDMIRTLCREALARRQEIEREQAA